MRTIPLRLLLAAQPKLVTPMLQVVHRVITRQPRSDDAELTRPDALALLGLFLGLMVEASDKSPRWPLLGFQRRQVTFDSCLHCFRSFREQRTAVRSFDCLVRHVIDPHPAPNWAELFEPRLVSIGAGSMWLRGFERVDGVGFVQEWRLDVQRAIKPGETYGPPKGELRADAPRL